jgi:hypothetical protein
VQMSVDAPLTSSTPQPNPGYSQLNASGTVTIGGTKLILSQGYTNDERCEDLRAGDVYTLIAASKRIGTFSGLPGGTTVRLGSPCGDHVNAALTDAAARIAYTPTGVTATITRGGHAGEIPHGRGMVRITGDAQVGHTVTAKVGWTGKPTSLRYDWGLCSPKGGGCQVLRDHSARLRLTAPMAYLDLDVVAIARNRYGSGRDYGELPSAIRPVRRK